MRPVGQEKRGRVQTLWGMSNSKACLSICSGRQVSKANDRGYADSFDKERATEGYVLGDMLRAMPYGMSCTILKL